MPAPVIAVTLADLVGDTHPHNPAFRAFAQVLEEVVVGDREPAHGESYLSLLQSLPIGTMVVSNDPDSGKGVLSIYLDQPLQIWNIHAALVRLQCSESAPTTGKQ